MFPGQFKIEGHSNPKNKKAFSKRKDDLLKRVKTNGRLRKRSPEKPTPQWLRYLIYGGLLLATFLLIFSVRSTQLTFQKMNQAHRAKMKALEAEYQTEPSSESLLIHAESYMKNGQYRKALNAYIELYKRAAYGPEIIRGMIAAYEKICWKENDKKFCRQAEEWSTFLEEPNQR